MNEAQIHHKEQRKKENLQQVKSRKNQKLLGKRKRIKMIGYI